MTENEERSRDSYVTTTGKRVEFVPIGGLLSLIQAQTEEPPPPKRRIETIGGDFKEEAMDEETAAHPSVSEEDKSRWRAYVQARDEARAERWRRTLDACLRRGIRIEIPDGNEWEREYQEIFDLTVPEEPSERRMFWIRAEVIGGSVDEVAIVTGVRLAGMVRREVTDAAKATFPSSERISDRATSGESVEETGDVVVGT